MVRNIMKISIRTRTRLDVQEPEPPRNDPEELLGIIPEDNRSPSVREVISRIVDGSRFHEFKPRYGTSRVWFYQIHGCL